MKKYGTKIIKPPKNNQLLQIKIIYDGYDVVLVDLEHNDNSINRVVKT